MKDEGDAEGMAGGGEQTEFVHGVVERTNERCGEPLPLSFGASPRPDTRMPPAQPQPPAEKFGGRGAVAPMAERAGEAVG
jgi:hypothetical protein